MQRYCLGVVAGAEVCSLVGEMKPTVEDDSVVAEAPFVPSYGVVVAAGLVGKAERVLTSLAVEISVPVWSFPSSVTP